MKRFVAAVWLLCSLLISIEALAVESGWWWNPTQSGRGFSIEIQGSSLFMAGYFYAADGRAIWLTASGPMTSATSFSAPLTAFGGGQTLTGVYQPNSLTNPNAGTLTLQFSDATHATLTWPGGTIPLERFVFASGTPSFKPDTGWWWNAAESGRGFYIEVQGSSLFMAGYMYDAAGNPIWYAAQGPMSTTTLFQSHWDQYHGGQTLTGAYQPPVLPPTNVGSVALQMISPTSATLTLPDGRSIALTRFPFAPTPALVGIWTGQWANTTFGSTGSATMSATANVIAQTFQATVDLNGSVFGGGDPAPLTFTGSYGTSGAIVTVNSALFGTLTLNVSPTGQISGNATPGGAISRVDFTGTWSSSTINIAYTITFAGGGAPAIGTLTFNKQ